MRVATSIVADLRKVEVKAELRKRYLFMNDVGNSDEDVVQLHEYAAAAGEPAAQVRLGEFYLTGSHGVPISYEKAFTCFEAAAMQGDARGRSLMGFMLEKGYGTTADASAALSLYEQAAQQQDSFGLVRLGFVYLQGRLGVPPDAKQAEHHLTAASKAGAAQAWLGLGQLARAADPKKAAKLFAVAAQKGSMGAAFELAQLQLAEDAALCVVAAQNLASVFEWSTPVRQMLQRAHELARPLAGGGGGGGGGREGNASLALRIYETLAWAGVEEAQANAAHLYHHALKDMETAARYYELSAEQGNAHSHLVLGDYYYNRQKLNLSHTAYRRASELHQLRLR